MDVTVAICTWNRAALLDQTLEAMCHLQNPPGLNWELFVVNNNCTDNTDEIAAKYRDKLPIRLLHQPTPGKSYALNYAVREAQGEFLLWTDDDALVAPDWITAFVEGFRAYPQVAIFGGHVDPWFEVEPPEWFLKAWPAISNAYAVRDAGKEPAPFTTKWPYGVNLAFRTEAQRKYEYDTELGRQPGSTIGGEEVHLVQQMVADGYQGWWLPAAKVRHFIPQQRLNVKYLENYFYGIGLARANMWYKNTRPVVITGLWKYRVRAMRQMCRYRLRRWTSPPQVWGHALREAQLSRGWADELKKLRRSADGLRGASDTVAGAASYVRLGIVAIICRDHGLLFIMAPRTGCTAIGELLCAELGGEYLPAEDILDDDGNIRIQKKHSTVRQLIDAGLLADEESGRLLKFTTVRNPFDSFASLYAKKSSRCEELLSDPQSFVHRMPKYRDDLMYCATHTFDEWIEHRFQVAPLNRMLGRGKRSLLGPYTEGVDFVMCYERLEDDFNEVLRRAGVQQRWEVPFVNKTKARTEHYRKYYSPRSRKIVEYAFSADLKKYNYQF